MMKQISLFAICLLMMASMIAQTVVPTTPLAVHEGEFPFIKKLKLKGNAFVMDAPLPLEEMTNVLKTRLEKESGQKVKSMKKGISGLESVIIQGISGNTYDYYYRVEDASENGVTNTRITFFTSVGNYNFLDSEKYAGEADAVKIWLQGLLSWKRLQEIVKAEAELQMSIQTVEKQQVELESSSQKLTEEKTKLDEEMVKLQEKLNALKEKQTANETAIQANTTAQEAQKKKIEEIRAQLQSLLNEKNGLKR